MQGQKKKCNVLRVTSPELKLHGVNMRETLKEVLDKDKARGCLKNIPDNAVEIVYCGGTRGNRSYKTYILNLLSNFLKSEKGKGRSLIPYSKLDSLEVTHVGHLTIKVPVKGMRIDYSDELKEMVWALQGAGTVFQNTLQEIRDRDKRKDLRRLLSLEQNLLYIWDQLNGLLAGKLRWQAEFINPDIIYSILEEPPEEIRDFIGSLFEICQRIEALNESRNITGITNLRNEDKRNVKKIMRRVGPILRNLIGVNWRLRRRFLEETPQKSYKW